jgi:hypothetical protein
MRLPASQSAGVATIASPDAHALLVLMGTPLAVDGLHKAVALPDSGRKVQKCGSCHSAAVVSRFLNPSVNVASLVSKLGQACEG